MSKRRNSGSYLSYLVEKEREIQRNKIWNESSWLFSLICWGDICDKIHQHWLSLELGWRFSLLKNNFSLWYKKIMAETPEDKSKQDESAIFSSHTP